MADKLPSLNVLSGPLAGHKFVIEDAVDNILIGSDSSCGFVLDTPGVSPIHARLWVDLNGATVYDTNSPAGVYVNDDRVVKESPVRNGDIIWLGPPGAEGSVLIQCILPLPGGAPAAAAAPPDEHVPVDTAPVEPSVDTGATMAFGMSDYLPDDLPDEPALAPPPAADADQEDIDSTVVMSSSALMGDPAAELAELEPTVSYPPTDATMLLDGSEGLEVIDEPTVAMPPPLAAPPPPAQAVAPPAPVEDIGGFPDFDVEPTVALAPPPLPSRSAAPPAAPPEEFEDELEPTMVDTPAPAIVAPPRASAAPMPPPVPDRDLNEDDDTSTVIFHATDAPVIAPPVPPPAPTPPAAASPPPPAAPAPVVPRPPRIAAPTPSAAPPVAPRPPAEARPTPRAAPAAPPAARPAVARSARAVPSVPPRRRSRCPPRRSRPPAAAGVGKGALIAAIGVVVAALAFAGYWFTRSPETPVAEATPIPAPPVTEAAAPITQAPAPVAVEPPVTQAPAPPETQPPAPVAVTTPAPVAPTAARTPLPSPRVAAATPPAQRPPAGQRPPVAATPAGPTAAQQTAAAVSNLLAQAKTASDAKNYDAAVAMYDEVLKLDPQNGAASAGRAAAQAARTASRRTFVSSRTVVQTEQKSKGGLSGFDSADVVQKNPDFLGRLEFVMNPSTVKPGDPYRLQIAMVNEGKKTIKISGMTFTVTVNGQKTGNPIAPKVKEVAPQQRVVLEELPGVFPAAANTWMAEVLVTANKGDSLRNQITWK